MEIDAIVNVVAVYKALVSEFAVFDRWFASVPSSTQPNRLYVHSGTSQGATSNDASLLIKGYSQQTIFDNIYDAGLSFGIYYQNIPSTLFYRNLRKVKYLTSFHQYGLSFASDAKNGNLPNYVVVEQRYMDSKIEPANDDHPSHDVYQVVHGPNGSPFKTSEFEHSSIPATVKKIFNLPSPFLTKRDAWAGSFEFLVQTLNEPRTDCPEKLPIPVRIRQSDANEDARLSEFQQELVQLASVLKGDHVLSSFQEKICKEITAKEGKDYMDAAVQSFFEAGHAAIKMGVDEDQVVQMKPSLTTRPSRSSPGSP